MRLELSGVGFSYGAVRVLEGISFDLETGELLAVVGENGAGKSTLLKCINRILECDAGTVTWGGRDVRRMSRREIASCMAYLPQKTFYPSPVTVFDVVLAGRYPRAPWMVGRRDEEAVWRALETLGIEDLAVRGFHTLSGGQQQKVLIARALAQEAALLLLDEPTTGLDIRHQLEVMDTVRERVEREGVAAVVTLHDLNLAARYADRVVMIHGGKVHAAGPPPGVLTPENIAAVYGVRVAVFEREGSPAVVALGTL